jgi:hypothetical protein
MSGGIPRYENWNLDHKISYKKMVDIDTNIAENDVIRTELSLQGCEEEVLKNGCNEELMVVFVEGIYIHNFNILKLNSFLFCIQLLIRLHSNY